MGFFGKKKAEEEVDEFEEENTLKTELEEEVEKLQNDFREKQAQLDEITQKITTVKEEYDSTVSSLMLVKKELNQKGYPVARRTVAKYRDIIGAPVARLRKKL